MPANYKSEMLETQTLAYSQEGQHYSLFIKLNWDASLHFTSEDNAWSYDPGDGGKVMPIMP